MNWAEGFKRARNGAMTGAMTGAMEKANDTWLTSPNQALMSVIPLGVGKSVMACSKLDANSDDPSQRISTIDYLHHTIWEAFPVHPKCSRGKFWRVSQPH